jgi:acetyl-CoA synthetase
MELEQLLKSKVSYRAPQSQQQSASVPDFWAEYSRSIQDP